jgi:hypothetical protein
VHAAGELHEEAYAKVLAAETADLGVVACGQYGAERLVLARDEHEARATEPATEPHLPAVSFEQAEERRDSQDRHDQTGAAMTTARLRTKL